MRAAISMSSRRSVALRSLPMTRWDPVVCKELSVGPDWRVQFDKALYTVPYRLIGERVLVLGSSQVVRIFLDFQEVTAHPRAKQSWQVMRRPDTMPRYGRAGLEVSGRRETRCGA